MPPQYDPGIDGHGPGQAELEALRRTVADLQRELARHRQESGLRLGLERMRAMLDELPVVCVYLDRTYVYRFANRAYLEMLGTDQASVIGRPLVEVIGPEALKQNKSRIDLALSGHVTEASVRVDYPAERGGPRYLESIMLPDLRADGTVDGYLSLAIDNTNRVRAEHALEDSEARYRHIFDHAHVGIYRTTPEGRIVVANPALVRMLGYDSLEELARRNLNQEGFGPQYSRDDFKRRIERDGEVRGLECEWQTRNGAVLMVRENARAVLDEAGQVAFYEGTVEDVTEARKAARALAESEERYRRMVESLPDGVAVYRDGVLIYANEATLSMVGASRADEVVGRKVMDFVHPDFHALANARIRAVLDGGLDAPVVEEVFLRLDGTPFHVEVKAGIVDLDDGPAIQAVFKDISIRHNALQALRDSEERYRTLVETSPEAIALTDLQGRFLAANRRFVEMLGFVDMSALQADGRPVFEFLQQPDKGPRGRPPISEGTVHGVEYRGHRRDGTTFPTEISTAVIKDVDGLPRAFMLVGRDITQRKQAEEIMRRQATRLAAMHEIDRAILTARSPEAIARSVLEHLQRILPCDRASVTVFDWPAREMVYLAVEGVASDLTPPGMRAPLSFFPVEDVQDTEAPNMLEDFQAIPNPSPLVRMLASQGLRSWLRVPLHGRGELVGVLTLARVQPGLFTREELEVARELGDTLSVALHNAHLQKHLRRHAMELERRVEERTRELKENMAELESFTYTVSHDLRAPLRAMQGLTQALVEDYGERLDDAGREFATRIMASSHRMEALIRDLLAYSRMGRDEMELHAVPLSQAVEHALTALEHDLAERQARVEVTEPLAVVKGHLATLQQVVQNLVGNAIKFVEPGVQPQVRVWTEPLASGDAVRLWVQDNGIGIEKRYHDRIFRVFERLHGGDTYPGTGIGLAIVHKAVARMGGRAGVDSAPGQGSRFWVELQKVEDEYAR